MKPVTVGEHVMDAPAGATVEKRGDGYEVAAAPHFRVFVKPALTTNVSHDDLTKPGWGLSELHEEKHEDTIRLYRAKSRNKTSWFVDVLVDVGSDTYECATTQSIENSEAFTHEDVDAMLAACRTLRAADGESTSDGASSEGDEKDAACDDDLSKPAARNKCKARCDKNEARACSDLADQLAHESHESSGPSQMDKAAALYSKACDGGYGSACLEFGHLAAAGFAGDTSPTKYRKMTAAYAKGCDLKDANSCLWLGDTYFKGADVPKDAPKAMSAYARGCALSTVCGCKPIKEGSAKHDKDALAALAAVKKQCDGGDKRACEGLKAAKP